MSNAPISDRGIYHKSQPTAHDEFRANTANHAKMAGVTYQRIICKACGCSKSVEGSKLVTPRHPKDGRICRDCLPAPEAAPPVSPKPVAKVLASPKEAKPPKAQLMTDEQVLECRTDYEFNGVKPATLVRRYGVTAAYMRNLLDYATRSKLIPDRHRCK